MVLMVLIVVFWNSLIVVPIFVACILISGYGVMKLLLIDKARKQLLLSRQQARRRSTSRRVKYRRDEPRSTIRQEVATLRTRIAELEGQIALLQLRSQGEPESPTVVEIIEWGGEKNRQTIESSSQQLKAEHRVLQDDLKTRKAAIEVLLSALKEALAHGVISENEYLHKQKKYQKELRSLDKKLHSFG
jgi:hypothetical protein